MFVRAVGCTEPSAPELWELLRSLRKAGGERERERLNEVCKEKGGERWRDCWKGCGRHCRLARGSQRVESDSPSLLFIPHLVSVRDSLKSQWNVLVPLVKSWWVRRVPVVPDQGVGRSGWALVNISGAMWRRRWLLLTDKPLIESAAGTPELQLIHWQWN